MASLIKTENIMFILQQSSCFPYILFTCRFGLLYMVFLESYLGKSSEKIMWRSRHNKGFCNRLQPIKRGAWNHTKTVSTRLPKQFTYQVWQIVVFCRWLRFQKSLLEWCGFVWTWRAANVISRRYMPREPLPCLLPTSFI